MDFCVVAVAEENPEEVPKGE